jgi:hypothetical protein
MRNLAAFREVRERLAAQYNVLAPSPDPARAPFTTG